MSDLVKRLTIKAGVMEMGERIAWGSDTALMREAADRIEELEAALNVAVKVTLVRAEAYLLTHIASHKAMSPKSRKGTYPQLNEYLVKDMVDTLTK